MKPHNPRSTPPTRYVGGAGHWNKRGNPKPKGEEMSVTSCAWNIRPLDGKPCPNEGIWGHVDGGGVERLCDEHRDVGPHPEAWSVRHAS